MLHMLWSWQLVDTEMHSSCQQMQCRATSPLPGVRTVRAHILRTLATRKFTQHVFLKAMSSSRSSHSCQSHCATMVASGCQRILMRVAELPIFQKKIATITSSACTHRLETWRHEIFLHVPQNVWSIKVKVLGRSKMAYTSTSPMQLRA